EKPRRTPDQKPIKAEMLLPKAQDRTVEQLSGGLTATDKEVQRIRRDIERLKEERSALRRQIQDALVSMKTNEPTDAGISAEILAEIQKLKRRQDEIDAREQLGTPGMSYPPANAAGDVPRHEQSSEEVIPAPVISVVGGEDDSAEETEAPQAPAPYITANAMFQAELLNGMDAPTDQSSRRNPVPA